MRGKFVLLIASVSAWMAAAVLSPAWSENQGEQDYDPHDFSGVWVKPGFARDPASLAADRADTRPETTFLRGKLPFTQAGRAAFDANRPTSGPRQVPSEMSDNDPRDGGNPPGLYRELQRSGNGRWMRMVHADDSLIMLLSTSRIWRIIYTDGRPVPEYHPAGPFWYGHSVGHWEGDTLVITTVSLDERQWLDNWGTPISMDAKTIERWTRTGPDELSYTLTVVDPTFYTEAWTSTPIYYVRTPGNEPFEIITAPMDIESYNDIILTPSATDAEVD